MDIVSRAASGLAPARSTSPIYPEGFVLHWVGGSGMNVAPNLEQSKGLMRALQADAFNRGYNDFEYNFAVDPSGNILEGRGWDRASGANGTTSSNQHLWAIVYLAGPGTPLTQAARGALFWLTQEGARRNARANTVTPHRNVYGVSTFCPGDECAAFCPELQAHLWDSPVDPPPPVFGPPPPPPQEEEDMRLLIQGPAPRPIRVELENGKFAAIPNEDVQKFVDAKTHALVQIAAQTYDAILAAT